MLKMYEVKSKTIMDVVDSYSERIKYILTHTIADLEHRSRM
jgi:hypothetical protein